ncbi:HDOD domain-containing protein [Catenuloplanes atrovinosus]|uniref:HD-like signal output (HDOD) protein/CheY-like chemotaxis protein n=1 Tax=Catenuloplanes atrovinosus TaxID=137266 RepID=A0AAE4C9Z9_9ACTN|nr:HDOD domain-containing protein [Catenuloplanes atrovinosus]MDR7275324.1 HD-like signal output (HDOD) protein/CheY-like chemotaxis protein [Catenuloplanes atrovinosus]
MSERPHVLFVDDEPMIIDGLRRMLRTCRERWAMSFAASGAAALEIMRTRPCDVVVTDYRMPEMDGAALLEQVRVEFPGTVRIILSGQTNEDNLLRIMVLAHEMLSKPTTPEMLIAAVDRLLQVRMRTDDGQQTAVAYVESLPSPPHTFAELLAALDADDASARSVSTVIEKDPAAAAKVLHLANSSAYTTGHKVSDVAQAVTLLGLHTVRGLVMMHDLIRVFDADGALPSEWIDGLTTHAVETSRLARLLGAGTGWESHAFTAGLLHEVGQLVLASARPKDFRTVLDAWASGGGGLADHEEAAFEASHVQVGTSLLGLWGLPTEVIDAIARHTAAPAPGPIPDAAAAVALAHVVMEADLGAVCGPHDATHPDDDHLDAAALAAIAQWRRDRTRP